MFVFFNTKRTVRASTHLFICARAQWRTYVSARPTRVRVRATTVSPSSAPPPPLILLNIRSRAAARSSQSSLESSHQQGPAAVQELDGPMRGGGWEDVTSHQQKMKQKSFFGISYQTDGMSLVCLRRAVAALMPPVHVQARKCFFLSVGLKTASNPNCFLFFIHLAEMCKSYWP